MLRVTFQIPKLLLKGIALSFKFNFIVQKFQEEKHNR